MPPRTIDEHHLQDLIAQRLNNTEIAQRMHIPRTTLLPYINKIRGIHKENTSTPTVTVSTHSIPKVHNTLNPTDAIMASWPDLQDILTWWRERKRLTQDPLRSEEETQRQTYHVEKRYIEAIKREADLERMSITKIVNRAFQQYLDNK